MDFSGILTRLDLLPGALDALLLGLPAADWRFRPPKGGWSILEVVNHLVDEETEDFRVRVRSMLEDPTREWPSLDPAGLVTARGYQERDPAASLARFREERMRTLAWLRSVRHAPWENSHVHPRAGTVHAGDLLAAWPAHDALHLAQIARLLHALAVRDGAPYTVGYAG